MRASACLKIEKEEIDACVPIRLCVEVSSAQYALTQSTLIGKVLKGVTISTPRRLNVPLEVSATLGLA